MTSEPADEAKRLAILNSDIVNWEQRRDAESIARLEDCLSSDLLFRRADRSIADKNTFMAGLQKPSPFTNRESQAVTVELRGERALVTMIVVGTKVDGAVGRYRNIRLFFRRDGRWQLELWFNDDVTGLAGLLGVE